MNESMCCFNFSLQLKNATQEAILRVRGDRNFENSRYKRAVQMFMTEYPNGDLRKSQRRPAGNAPHKRPKRNKNVIPEEHISIGSDSDDSVNNDLAVNLSDISSDGDAWTSSDEEI